MTVRLQPHLRRREAEAAYEHERHRASRQWTFHLLRQERHWARCSQRTETQQVRLKAVRDELRDRGVIVPAGR